MKLERGNFEGKTEVEYRIKSTIKNTKEVFLYYQIKTPINNQWIHVDCKIGIGKNTTEALKDAVKRAEEQWKIKLTKEEILKTA